MTRTQIAIADPLAGQERDEVRRALVERRRELLHQIQRQIRAAREERPNAGHRATDADDAIDVEPDDELAFTLVQMKGQALSGVAAAVRRLDEGAYGYCVDCAGAIAAARLRALPFAVRCKACEEEHEGSFGRLRAPERRSLPGAGFEVSR
jgi:DnaK suppressor protein